MASATGPSDARFETTAAWQATEASNLELQKDVEKNANKAHNVAEQAAAAAQFKAPAASVAVNNLEEGLSEKTNEAVAEGRSTVDSAKATGAGYVQQAREIAGTAFATAASYLPTSISGNTTTTADGTTTHNGGVVASVQSAAGTAVGTAKTVLSTAQETAQPYVNSAIETAQPYVNSAIETAKPHVEKLTNAVTGTGHAASSQVTTKPADVPATTAPLEGANGHVGGPYSSQAV